jgi:hypothetical protein
LRNKDVREAMKKLFRNNDIWIEWNFHIKH